jgi:hypothetical protein
MVAGLLASRQADLVIDDPGLAAFVLVASIEAITHAPRCSRPSCCAIRG